MKKHILITGASTGIGFDLVQNFLKNGFTVWAGVRNTSVFNDVHLESENLNVLKLDVTSQADIDFAFSKISNALEKSSEFILINNAGIAIGGPVEFVDIQDWRNLFEVNVFGLFNMTRKFLPLLRSSQGRIINIGSLSGRIATPFLSVYSASKFAVRAFSDSLRREMLPFGVKVVLVEPGPIKTKIWGKSVEKSLGLQANASDEIKKIYSVAISKVEESVRKTEASAIEAQVVSDLVLRTLESSNPKPYYLVGKNVGLINCITKILPTKMLDRLLMQGFRFSK